MPGTPPWRRSSSLRVRNHYLSPDRSIRAFSEFPARLSWPGMAVQLHLFSTSHHAAPRTVEVGAHPRIRCRRLSTRPWLGLATLLARLLLSRWLPPRLVETVL